MSASESQKKKLGTAEDVLAACAALEEELAQVRAAYDQYFAGVERQPPAKAHATLKKKVGALKQQFIKHTAASFRIANLSQKLSTYERLWERSLKEIEDGTSRRDAFRLKRKAERRLSEPKASSPAAPVHSLDEDLDLSDLDEPVPEEKPVVPAAAKPSTPVWDGASLPSIAPTMKPLTVAPPKVPRPHPPVASDGGLSDKKIRAIYEAYVTAKKRCGEDVSKLSFETVSTTLKKQVPTLLKQHKANAVEFKVVIKDGKAILRALPKE